MENKYLFISLILVISNLNSLSQKFQPGYIITDNLDTVYGLVANNNFIENAKSCQFKKTDSSEVSTYQPFDINSYRFTDGKYYISKEITIDSVRHKAFLEYLIKGKANIYYLRNSTGDYYFVQKENDSMIILRSDQVNLTFNQTTQKWAPANNSTAQGSTQSKKYIGTMKYILRDAPTLYNEIDRADLDHKSLIKIAKDYHNLVCKDASCIIYEKKNKLKLGLEITSMIGINKYSSTNVGNTEYSDFKLQIYGVTVILPLSLLNESIDFKSGILFGTTDIKTTQPEVGRDLITSYSASNLDIPLTLQYNFVKQRKWKVYFGLGPQIGYTSTKLDDSYYLSSIGKIPFSPSEDEYYSAPFKGMYLGGCTALGASILITRRLFIDVAANYALTAKIGSSTRSLITSSVSIGYLLNSGK